MMKFLYQKFLKPILFCFSPDSVHHFFVLIGEKANRFPIFNRLIQIFYGVAPKNNYEVDGLKLKGRVLLAAGFDYNGKISHALNSIGFAGEEVGSVTAKPCIGNKPPNLKRLIKSKSIQVYKGLRNDGVEKVIARLKNTLLPKDFILGISIAKTNSKDCTSIEEGVEDYTYSLKRLNEENMGDFYTINISCPNAYGGEDFASPNALEKLCESLAQIKSSKPIYFKLPINKPWSEIKELIEIILKYKFQGVVIGNLNKDYESINYPEELESQNFRGGLSGLACKKLSTDLIKKTRDEFKDITIIGCGGILSVEDAMEKINAGANLLQLISGMIFNGPHLINEINEALKHGQRKHS